jgi:ATP-binding cassette subfamily B protein
MSVLEPLTSEIERQWRSVADPQEELLISAMADLTADGNFGQRWLLVSTQRVLVLGTNGAGPQETAEVPLSEISEAKTESLVGGGRLTLQVSGHPRPLITYTNSEGDKFAEVAAGITQLTKGEELHIAEHLRPMRCPKCGRRLPDRDGVCPTCVRKGAVFMRITYYLGPYKWQAVGLAGLMFGRTLAQLIPPMLTKRMIDEVITPRQNFSLLIWLVGGLAAVGLFTAASEAASGWLAAWLGAHIIAFVRAELFRCLERLSLRFHDRKETGSLMSLVTQDTDRLHMFLVEGLPYLVTNSLMLLGIVGVLLSINWQLTLVILIPTPALFIGGGLFWRRMRRLFHRWWQRWSSFSAELNESLTGIRVTKAFAQEEAEIRKFDRHNEDLLRAGVVADGTWFGFFATMNFFTSTGALFAWLMGGRAIIAGEITLGTLMAFINYLWLFYGPLQWFNQVYNWMSRAFAGADRIFAVLDTEPEPYSAPHAVHLPRIRGDVTFEDVTFGYDKSKPVLKNVDCLVKAGELIGLVGKSGAGKTTLINLVCRFYDVDRGRVTIDGHDIHDIRLEDLRNQIGIVLQEPFLFNGTITENIRYGRPDATFADIISAARAANAHEFIVAKPNGYDTRVGERGTKLSVGEKQRISIARAVLRDPRMLILDEATSSVDTETETAIQEALARLVKGRTTFVIAHRLSTLRNADRLLVVDDGCITEMGTHEELMAKKGTYHRLVELQLALARTKGVGG